jgi:hypothetical protein
MIKKSLLAVQGPSHFIAGYIALSWCEKKVFKINSDITLLIYDTCVSKENEHFFQETVRSLARINNFKNIVFISRLEMREISKSFFKSSLNKLKKTLKEDCFDYIYLSRNYGNFGNVIIPNAYEKSIKIEFGDAFGLVGEQRFMDFNFTFKDLFTRPISYLKYNFFSLLYLHFFNKTKFNIAVLSMPLIWDVNYLNEKTTLIPEKKFVEETFELFSKLITDLNVYCEELICKSQGINRLYLLSSLFPAGYCNLENEVELYEKIILKTAKLNDRIILKNHPRGSDEVLKELEKKLKLFYDVKVIYSKKYDFIPIELWHTLIKNSNVYPIFSISSISLKYLYSKNVELTLNKIENEKYFFSDKLNLIRISNEMFEKSILKLDQWDEQTPLWVKD